MNTCYSLFNVCKYSNERNIWMENNQQHVLTQQGVSFQIDSSVQRSIKRYSSLRI